ncbi:hypothetical protein Tsubulata_050638 [Turnera subulata]|uniref:Uncharacterized protein n=1 Tax=Turnera subulata TaxID=218843 RepID=A0A9Q0JQ46_9ROSI|nr:hypothetical protein Tsubulata_050638 [Turnera subulata]
MLRFEVGGKVVERVDLLRKKHWGLAFRCLAVRPQTYCPAAGEGVVIEKLPSELNELKISASNVSVM